MTQQQRQQLDRAFAIAARDALRAIRGTTRDGQPVYAVLNRRATAKAAYPVYHLLHVEAGRIVCDCPAHLNGRVCAHAAAVRSAIQAERDAAAQRAADAACYREYLLNEYPAPGFHG